MPGGSELVCRSWDTSGSICCSLLAQPCSAGQQGVAIWRTMPSLTDTRGGCSSHRCPSELPHAQGRYRRGACVLTHTAPLYTGGSQGLIGIFSGSRCYQLCWVCAKPQRGDTKGQRKELFQIAGQRSLRAACSGLMLKAFKPQLERGTRLGTPPLTAHS